jgi:hypothetical protein
LSDIVRILDRSPDPSWVPARIPDAAIDFITWGGVPGRIDAGVSDDVARVLSAALCGAADVMFLGGPHVHDAAYPLHWNSCAVDSWCSLVRLPLFSGTPFRRRDIPLTYTRSPDVLSMIFEMPEFDWTLRAQLAWLFPRGGNPPQIDPSELDALLKADPPSTLPPGAIGLFRPGIDGDFAELLTRESRTREEILRRVADIA